MSLLSSVVCFVKQAGARSTFRTVGGKLCHLAIMPLGKKARGLPGFIHSQPDGPCPMQERPHEIDREKPPLLAETMRETTPLVPNGLGFRFSASIPSWSLLALSPGFTDEGDGEESRVHFVEALRSREPGNGSPGERRGRAVGEKGPDHRVRHRSGSPAGPDHFSTLLRTSPLSRRVTRVSPPCTSPADLRMRPVASMRVME